MIRDLVLQNRTCRRFHQEVPIEHETLRELVDLARCSASGSNKQSLRYILSYKSERNDLIFEFLRFVKGLMPKAVMMENVPGLQKDERFKKLCKELEGEGYIVNQDVLDAADYGVPQRRRRLILLASKIGKIEFAKKAARKTVGDAIKSMPPVGKSGDSLHDYKERRSEKVKRLIKRIPKDGGGRKDLGKRYQLACHKKCDGFKDVYGRMSWNGVAPTITSGCTNPSKGRFLHPNENRAITLREAALLQSFPKSYRFDVDAGKGAVAEMLGNALPPLFIRKHSTNICRAIQEGG